MTRSTFEQPGVGPTEIIDSAAFAAEAAAASSGVRIRAVNELQELRAVSALYAEVWGPDPTRPPITTELLRGIAHAGNYIGGAFDDGELVGACVGFFGAPSANAMHSHIAAVSASKRGSSIGFALKLHQRSWALLSGVETISWTFDPLIRRNAYFNLAKLGATPVKYMPDFYGAMNDRVNAGTATDRLVVRWNLAAPTVVRACAGKPIRLDAEAARQAGAPVLLDVCSNGSPTVCADGARTGLIAIPTDIETLRATDPTLASRWRFALRQALANAMSTGSVAPGFDPKGWYLVAEPQSSETTALDDAGVYWLRAQP